MAASAYEPLPSSQSIRILWIHPASSTDKVVCTLEVANLDVHPAYLALSYTWGDPSSVKSIECNSVSSTVTENLFAALVRFRDRKERVAIWVDQLCINQNDLAERAQQVRIMGQVYVRASWVWIWLGEETDDSLLAMSLVRRLSPLLGSTPQRSLVTRELRELGLTRQQAATDFDALAALYRRRWFERLWVIQEAVLATNLSVACGEETLSWQELDNATCFIWQSGLNLMEYGDDGSQTRSFYTANLSRLRNIIDLRREVAIGWSLLEILVFTREARATDPRDKIYSVLGLTSQTGAEDPKGHPRLSREVRVDYKQSIEDIFISVAILLIERSPGAKGLEVLYAAGRRSQWSNLKLPSWVPDWSVDKQDILWWNAEESQYQAAKSSSAKLSVDVTKNYLTIAGKYIDVIKVLDANLSESEQSENPTNRYWLQEREFLLNREAIATQYSMYNAADITEPLWRTLIANRDSAFHPASPDIAQFFDDFRAGLDHISMKGTVKQEHEMNHYKFAQLQKVALLGRRFFVSSKGYIGLAPEDSRVGDSVCVVFGGTLPIVLRPEGDEFVFLGECYFHGFMGGEATEREDLETRDFVLK